MEVEREQIHESSGLASVSYGDLTPPATAIPTVVIENHLSVLIQGSLDGLIVYQGVCGLGTFIHATPAKGIPGGHRVTWWGTDQCEFNPPAHVIGPGSLAGPDGQYQSLEPQGLVPGRNICAFPEPCSVLHAQGNPDTCDPESAGDRCRGAWTATIERIIAFPAEAVPLLNAPLTWDWTIVNGTGDCGRDVIAQAQWWVGAVRCVISDTLRIQ